MKAMIEVDIPEGRSVTDAMNAVKRAFDPDWMAEWWHIDDVIEQAENQGEQLTEQEARDVLMMVSKRHDCNVGINWDVIDYWIDQILEDREHQDE